MKCSSCLGIWGSKNVITKEWVNEHLRWRVEFDPVAALFTRHGKGAAAVWTLRELGALSESERTCLESYDIVKGNVNRSDDSLETVIKPRWYAKDKALELCARSLGMLKDTMHVTTSESIGSVKMRTFHQDSGDSTTDQGCLEETSVWKRRAFRKEIRENQNPNCAVSPSVPGDKTGR